MKKLFVTAALLAAALGAQAKDIVDTAVAAGQFKTLATALQAAGLVDTLKGPGPFTVFAPTDEAFAKIPKATLDGLLADKAALTKVLTYHVVPGKVTARQAAAARITAPGRLWPFPQWRQSRPCRTPPCRRAPCGRSRSWPSSDRRSDGCTTGRRAGPRH